MTEHTPATDLIPNLQRSAISAFSPLQREINRIFDEFSDSWNAFTQVHFAPRMDVSETKDAVEVSVELPGLTRDQVKITAEDETLTVSGEKKSETEQVDGNFRLTERSYGEFSRSIYLPRSADTAKICAVMEGGVLKITVPKRPGAEARTVEIQSN